MNDDPKAAPLAPRQLAWLETRARVAARQKRNAVNRGAKAGRGVRSVEEIQARITARRT